MQATNDREVTTDLPSNDVTTDQTSNALSETTTVDPMVNDKSEQDETTIEHSPTNTESTELDNRSSLLLVDLVETIFSKKEIKPIDQVPKSMTEESRNSSQDRPESESTTID